MFVMILYNVGYFLYGLFLMFGIVGFLNVIVKKVVVVIKEGDNVVCWLIFWSMINIMFVIGIVFVVLMYLFVFLLVGISLIVNVNNGILVIWSLCLFLVVILILSVMRGYF